MDLANLEAGLGFRSSFNFIPEGSYRVSEELRSALKRAGFEIGVHDLHHDGQLFASESAFRQYARKINQYLLEWGAVGFRSGFMMRNLDWVHQLNIRYDASTFDTDPFEPQPEGLGTIFPQWMHGPGQSGGYAELPYTLPQDSTLFLLLKDDGLQIWKDKIEWIAERGGMALLNVHPDYLTFSDGGRPGRSYSAACYADFLAWVKNRYRDRYWHGLPSEVADVARPA